MEPDSLLGTRYGFYLRPSAPMSLAQVAIHDLLERQYGLRVAGTFMPHATIKGFFRTEAPVSQIVSAIDGAIAGIEPFDAFVGPVVGWAKSAIVLDLQRLPGGLDNIDMRNMHRRAWKALLPLVHPACEQTWVEWAEEKFTAHLTLAMADIPREHFDEILRFVQELEPIGPPAFRADRYHLYAFESEHWGGQWWRDLRWSLLHSWQLPESTSR